MSVKDLTRRYFTEEGIMSVKDLKRHHFTFDIPSTLVHGKHEVVSDKNVEYVRFEEAVEAAETQTTAAIQQIYIKIAVIADRMVNDNYHHVLDGIKVERYAKELRQLFIV